MDFYRATESNIKYRDGSVDVKNILKKKNKFSA